MNNVTGIDGTMKHFAHIMEEVSRINRRTGNAVVSRIDNTKDEGKSKTLF